MPAQQPLHVGVIIDGNRRWATKRGLPIIEGHRVGAENIQRLLNWCREFDVYEVTIYTFSAQNFRRPLKEVRDLMHLFRQYFLDLLNDYRLHKYRIRVRVAGQINRFPLSLQKILHRIIEVTKQYRDYQVNFALAYGGREELVEATRALAAQAKRGTIKPDQINEKMITDRLYISRSADLVIRTGGELRTSNFLPWQTTYSEWFFVKKMWPAFQKSDFRRILEQFRTRERRFGR